MENDILYDTYRNLEQILEIDIGVAIKILFSQKARNIAYKALWQTLKCI